MRFATFVASAQLLLGAQATYLTHEASCEDLLAGALTNPTSLASWAKAVSALE